MYATDISSRPRGASAAIVTRTKTWGTAKKFLKVKFLNDDDVDRIKVGGEPANINNIMTWARVWNIALCDEIPRFETEQRKDKPADIRVKFVGNNNFFASIYKHNIIKLYYF